MRTSDLAYCRTAAPWHSPMGGNPSSNGPLTGAKADYSVLENGLDCGYTASLRVLYICPLQIQ